MLRARLRLPREGGPSLAGCAVPGVAAAWGAGLIGTAPALALLTAAIAILVPRWRRLAEAERIAGRLTKDDAPAPLPDMLHRAAERLASVDHRLAHFHPVTGLPMRERLFTRVAADIAADGAEAGARAVHRLGLLRLANFERIAGFDQPAADATLAVIADRLGIAMRGAHLLAQVDRDCFALWLCGDDADTLIAEFRALGFVAAQETEIEGVAIQPLIECGMAAWPEDGATPPLLLARATAALAAPGTEEEAAPVPSPRAARERFVIERDLAHALEADELAMVFQPVVDIAAGRLVGAEALLRWTHPELGAISPAIFIPVVEEMGLSEPYGLWVLNAAAREARRWRDDGHDLCVAVNLSARQLGDPSLALKIARTVERHRLPPGALELELTETAAMADAAHTARLFAELREAGIRLSIDDFGTGYSSLSYLKNLPFDKLKIDREFVTGVQHRRDSRAICAALCALGKGLGLAVLAEGVECAEEVAVLRDLGCHLFQGYHFARPLSAEAFRAIARDADWLRTLASPVHHRLALARDRLAS